MILGNWLFVPKCHAPSTEPDIYKLQSNKQIELIISQSLNFALWIWWRK